MQPVIIHVSSSSQRQLYKLYKLYDAKPKKAGTSELLSFSFNIFNFIFLRLCLLRLLNFLSTSHSPASSSSSSPLYSQWPTLRNSHTRRSPLTTPRKTSTSSSTTRSTTPPPSSMSTRTSTSFTLGRPLKRRKTMR